MQALLQAGQVAGQLLEVLHPPLEQRLVLLELVGDGRQRALEPAVQVLAHGLKHDARLGDQTVVEALHQEVLLGHDVHRVAAEALGVGLEPLHRQDVLLQVERRRRQVDEAVLLLELLIHLVHEAARLATRSSGSCPPAA